MAPGPTFVKGKVAGLIPWLTLALLFAVPGLGAAEMESFDYSAYARVLAEYVTPEGQVRYLALKENPDDLKTFLGQLATFSPENSPERFPTPEARMAYWINAYNAFVLDAVVEAYPVDSVRALKFGFGLLFFKRSHFVAGDKRYSLDDIEHGILRKRFSEPRVHFALNCASASCPPIGREPYRAEKLDAQLDAAARDFIRQKENVWMRGDVLFLSKIFDWYGKDFVQWLKREGDETPTVVDYVVRYLPEPVAAQVKKQRPRLEFYGYDWSLNDAAARAD